MTLTLCPPAPTTPALRSRVRRDRAYVPTGDIGRRLAAAQSLQLQIQELTAQLDTHRTWLLNHMQRRDLDRLELGAFQVIRKTRHNWTYTPETERNMLALRTAQKWEQAQGLATDNPTVYIALSTTPSK